MKPGGEYPPVPFSETAGTHKGIVLARIPNRRFIPSVIQNLHTIPEIQRIDRAPVGIFDAVIFTENASLPAMNSTHRDRIAQTRYLEDTQPYLIHTIDTKPYNAGSSRQTRFYFLCDVPPNSIVEASQVLRQQPELQTLYSVIGPWYAFIAEGHAETYEAITHLGMSLMDRVPHLTLTPLFPEQ